MHPTQNFKAQCIARSVSQISTGVPVKKPVSRSYPKIIGFWTSSGRILLKLCQSDVQTHVYWCLKYDTLWWLIWGHITKCYNSACGWVKAVIDTSKWSQLNAASVKGHMTPVRWPLHVFRRGHITFINIFSYIRVIYLYQGLKWSELNIFSPNCNKTPLWWLICLFKGSHITKCYNSACGWVKAVIETSKWSQLNAASVEGHMTPVRWPLHVFKKGHITFINIFSYIQVWGLFQSLKWSGLNHLPLIVIIHPVYDSFVCLELVILQNAIFRLMEGLIPWSIPQNDRNCMQFLLKAIWHLSDYSFIFF